VIYILCLIPPQIKTGRALGFPDSPDGLPSSVVESTLARTRETHQKADCIHIPSMLLDVRNRRPIEVEVVVGEVVRMAHARGVGIPVSDHLGWQMTTITQKLSLLCRYPAHRAIVFDVVGHSKPDAG
jgi:ketopantoate reductase